MMQRIRRVSAYVLKRALVFCPVYDVTNVSDLTFVLMECTCSELLGVCQQISYNNHYSTQSVCVGSGKERQLSGMQVSSDIFLWHVCQLWAVEQQTPRRSPFPSPFHSPFCSQQPLQVQTPLSNKLYLPREAVEQNCSLYHFICQLQIMNIKARSTD